MKKLTNQVVDQKLMGRDIIRLDDYIDAKTKIRFQCVKDNFIWEAAPSNILNAESGCPKCIGYYLTNNDIDQALVDRNIKRIDDYIGAKKKIRFQCMLDNFIWKVLPYNVMFKTGCPKCVNCVALSNDAVDQRLIGRNIVRVGDFIRTDLKMSFKCLECSSIWSAQSNSVLNGGSGCPKCYGNAPLSNEMIDQELVGRDIVRLDDYKGALFKIRFQCVKDSFVWSTSPNNLINNETGCPNCSIGKNEKLVATILQNSNIPFERHKRIKHINDGGDVLVDFCINSGAIIEYNGEQHYRPVCFGGISLEEAQKKYEKQSRRDNNLTTYCCENNIKLIYIDGREYVNSKLQQFMFDLIEELKNVQEDTPVKCVL